jgi:ABC-type antimicrobial peptide transport system permease subunit
VALYTRFLALLGAVSLVVGSLGVANVMLVSVVERRAEIGLRAAIGARPADIALQFVIESLLICLGGALAGLLLGLAGSAAALALAHIELSIGAGTLAAVALLVMGSGLVAGLYPALRAARLDPATTLQGS